MCILCALKVSDNKSHSQPEPKPVIDKDNPVIAFAIRVLGEDAVIAEFKQRQEQTLPALLKSASAFSNRVYKAAKEQGLTYPKFLAEFNSEPKTTQGEVGTPPTTSIQFLDNAKRLQESRAAQYDQPEGERSMAKTVTAFNTITGHTLSETDAWLMMTLLKAVRANQGDFKSDNYEDLVSYTALLAESAVKEQG